MATVTLEIEFQQDENSFHTTYKVEKYTEYAKRFERAARDALGEEGIDHDVRFNPGPGRGYHVYPPAPLAPMKGWYTKDKMKVRYPRLGAFEVVLKAPSRPPLPERSVVWSKLLSHRWPNPKELAACVARALSSGDAELLQRIESKCAGEESSTQSFDRSTRSRPPSPHPPMFFGIAPRHGIASPTEVRSASSGAPRARRPLSAMGARDGRAAGSSARASSLAGSSVRSSRPGSAKSMLGADRPPLRPVPAPLSPSPAASASTLPPGGARAAWTDEGDKAAEPTGSPSANGEQQPAPAQEPPVLERTLAPGESLSAAAAAADANGAGAEEPFKIAADAAEGAAPDPADASYPEFEQSFEGSAVIAETNASAAKEATVVTDASELVASSPVLVPAPAPAVEKASAPVSPGGDSTAARLRKQKSEYDDFEEDFEEEDVEDEPASAPAAAQAVAPAAAPVAATGPTPDPAPAVLPTASSVPVEAPTPSPGPSSGKATKAPDYDEDDFEETLEADDLPAAAAPSAAPAAAAVRLAAPSPAPAETKTTASSLAAPTAADSRRGDDAYSDDDFDDDEAESPVKPAQTVLPPASPAKPLQKDGSGSSTTRASNPDKLLSEPDEDYEDDGFEIDEPPTSPQARLKPEDHTKDAIVVDGHSFDYAEDAFDDEGSVDVSNEDNGSVKSVED